MSKFSCLFGLLKMLSTSSPCFLVGFVTSVFMRKGIDEGAVREALLKSKEAVTGNIATPSPRHSPPSPAGCSEAGVEGCERDSPWIWLPTDGS